VVSATKVKNQNYFRGMWLAQSEKHETPDLGVMSSSPMLGVQILKLKKKKRRRTRIL